MPIGKQLALSALAVAIACSVAPGLPSTALAGQSARTCTIADYRHLSRLFIAIAETTERCARALEHSDEMQPHLCRTCRNAVSAGAALRSWLARNPHCDDPYYQPVFRTSRALAQDVRRRCN